MPSTVCSIQLIRLGAVCSLPVHISCLAHARSVPDCVGQTDQSDPSSLRRMCQEVRCQGARWCKAHRVCVPLRQGKTKGEVEHDSLRALQVNPEASSLPILTEHTDCHRHTQGGMGDV
jgi:hypothetical protein